MKKNSNTYRELLNIFTGTDIHRPEVHRPFIIGEYAIATDHHSLICFNKNNLQEIDFLDNPGIPSALSIMPEEDNTDINFTVDEVKEKISALLKLTEETYTITDGDCPDCNNKRQVDYKFIDYTNHIHTIKGDCPTCKNGEEIKITVNKQTGEIIGEFCQLLKVNEDYIKFHFLKRIIAVAEALSVKSFKLVYQKNRGVHKFIVGDCTILVMPIYSPEPKDLVTILK